MLPEYYAQKLNIFIALAPVARLTNSISPLFRELAQNLDEVEHLLIDELGMYDVFAPNWIFQYETVQFCQAQPAICEGFL